ncbi:hypothetical protein GLAREA_10509 [Glarea lozoyensis ATCC 20868]|uniref:Uncharacterized protein n=1 Tax=Glarea lozoyensis (strain ATCC 20868 / MF5171) TaxID=1116229 RepID=S3DCM8_GLAL2|nr:uncharacterized protein GLAREA_10509 [Glarea lozoyensis ATCC 20868]EPE34814.1 hypothetical protein GLAREA_10509 [Glarea lozoyensis ATCC 20868]
MPKEEQSKYAKAFRANKAERKAAREMKKKEKLEQQKLATEFGKARNAEGFQKRKWEGDEYPGNKRRTDVALSNPSSSSALPPAKVKIETVDSNHDSENDDDQPDPTTSVERYLAEFRHGESDLHLRALLWQRKVNAERKVVRRQMNQVAA